MDTATLVDEQIEEGKGFIDHLRQSGIDVAAALWVLTSEDQLWFFYIASSEVETSGLAIAYRKVYAELANCPIRWILRSDIKLIGQTNPIAVDAIRYRSKLATRYHGRTLGNLIVEEAYIYPKT